jgi:hypothetical protein
MSDSDRYAKILMVTKIIDALFMAELMEIRKMKNLKLVKPTTFTTSLSLPNCDPFGELALSSILPIL